jgi:methylmalonic aciduria homocystinuria type C protein
MSTDAPFYPELLARLSAAGLDLTATFDVAAYNAAVEPELALPTFGRASTAGLLIGNTGALWERFVRWVRESPGRAALADPFDEYVTEHVSAALEGWTGPRLEVRYGYELRPRLVALVTVAEVAGFAWRAPCQLAIHPEYGPWVSLRAVLVADAPGPGEKPAAPACTACAHACQPALQAALAASEPTADAVHEEWQTWLAVRDACPVGNAHRYPDAAIRYHYALDRSGFLPPS